MCGAWSTPLDKMGKSYFRLGLRLHDLRDRLRWPALRSIELVSFDAFATNQGYRDKASARAARPCNLIAASASSLNLLGGLVYTPRQLIWDEMPF